MPNIQDQTPQPSNQENIKESMIGVSTPPEPVVEKPQPIIKYPPFLWEKTQNLIKEIEQKINTKIVVYFTSPMASIANDDVDFFFSHVSELQPESSLTIILISNGGSVTASWRIANVLRHYCSKLTVLVPSRCASAATLLALSAEEIQFGPAGYLTAIDSSLTHPLNPRPSEKEEPISISVDQVKRVKDFIDNDLKIHPSSKGLSEILFEKIHPIVFGELQRSSSLSKLVARNMIKLRTNAPSEEEQIRITDTLNDSYPMHGYPIVLREALQLGLPAKAISQDLNPLLWELTKLYSLISKQVLTHFAPNHYHLEGIPVLLESMGKRTFYVYSYDKRLLPQLRVGWIMENEKNRWLSATSDPSSPEKPRISELEL